MKSRRVCVLCGENFPSVWRHSGKQQRKVFFFDNRVVCLPTPMRNDAEPTIRVYETKMLFGAQRENAAVSQFIFSFWLGKFCGRKAPLKSEEEKQAKWKSGKGRRVHRKREREEKSLRCIDCCSDFVRCFGCRVARRRKKSFQGLAIEFLYFPSRRFGLFISGCKLN